MKPYRNFSAQEGEKSKNPLRGPGTIMGDLDRICCMFDPCATHVSDSGEILKDLNGNEIKGGIIWENVQDGGLLISNTYGLSDALNNKSEKAETDQHIQNEQIHTTAEEKNKLSNIENGAQVNTVNSVLGKTGDVTFNKADLGLSNVDNTSDLAKTVNAAISLTPGALINGVRFDGTSNITIEDSTKLSLSQGSQPGGFPPLDSNAKIPIKFLKGAVIKSNGDWYFTAMGDLSSLATTDKTSLVNATNEIYSLIGDIDCALDSIIAIQIELIGGGDYDYDYRR